MGFGSVREFFQFRYVEVKVYCIRATGDKLCKRTIYFYYIHQLLVCKMASRISVISLTLISLPFVVVHVALVYDSRFDISIII